MQSEAREAETTKAAEELAAKVKAAAEGRQRLAAEKKTLEQAQGVLDTALLEVGYQETNRNMLCDVLPPRRRWSKHKARLTPRCLR